MEWRHRATIVEEFVLVMICQLLELPSGCIDMFTLNSVLVRIQQLSGNQGTEWFHRTVVVYGGVQCVE